MKLVPWNLVHPVAVAAVVDMAAAAAVDTAAAAAVDTAAAAVDTAAAVVDTVAVAAAAVVVKVAAVTAVAVVDVKVVVVATNTDFSLTTRKKASVTEVFFNSERVPMRRAPALATYTFDSHYPLATGLL